MLFHVIKGIICVVTGKMLRLSIIVPLYNSEKYLPKCLDSLLSQDIPETEYEIILVDDGSPDDSLALAERYASRFPNIVVLSQKNKGTSGARNTGMRRASGRYICFVDPDDYVQQNSFRRILERMEKESLDILRFGYTEVDEQYKPTKSCKHPEEPDYSSCVMDGFSFMAERLGVACYVWTYLFRTSLLTDNGLFFPEGVYFDDTPWLPRVLALANRVDSIDFKRYFYLIRSNSLVQSVSKESIRKKIDGQLFLVSELSNQKVAIQNANATIWYQKMIVHCVVTVLTLVALYDYQNRRALIKELKDRGVLPFNPRMNSGRNQLKLKLVSHFPSLFCRVIHLRNQFKVA